MVRTSPLGGGGVGGADVSGGGIDVDLGRLKRQLREEYGGQQDGDGGQAQPSGDGGGGQQQPTTSGAVTDSPVDVSGGGGRGPSGQPDIPDVPPSDVASGAPGKEPPGTAPTTEQGQQIGQRQREQVARQLSRVPGASTVEPRELRTRRVERPGEPDVIRTTVPQRTRLAVLGGFGDFQRRMFGATAGLGPGRNITAEQVGATVEAREDIRSTLEAETGEDITFGEDYTLEFGDGQVRAEPTEAFRSEERQEAVSGLESKLEEQYGVELDREDVAVEQRGGQLYGTLSRAGEETVAVQTAPFRDTFIIGGLTTTGARIRQFELRATDPFAETYRELTPDKADVYNVTGETVPGAGELFEAGETIDTEIDETLDPARNLSQAQLNQIRNATLENLGVEQEESGAFVAAAAPVAGVTGVGTGAAATGTGAGIGTAAAGSGVGLAALAGGSVLYGFGTGDVDPALRRSRFDAPEDVTRPFDVDELAVGDAPTDVSELTPSLPGTAVTELDPDTATTDVTELLAGDSPVTATELPVPEGAPGEVSGEIGTFQTRQVSAGEVREERERERETDRPAPGESAFGEETRPTGRPGFDPTVRRDPEDVGPDTAERLAEQRRRGRETPDYFGDIRGLGYRTPQTEGGAPWYSQFRDYGELGRVREPTGLVSAGELSATLDAQQDVLERVEAAQRPDVFESETPDVATRTATAPREALDPYAGLLPDTRSRVDTRQDVAVAQDLRQRAAQTQRGLLDGLLQTTQRYEYPERYGEVPRFGTPNVPAQAEEQVQERYPPAYPPVFPPDFQTPSRLPLPDTDADEEDLGGLFAGAREPVLTAFRDPLTGGVLEAQDGGGEPYIPGP